MLRLDIIAWSLITTLLAASPLSNTPALRHLLAFGLLLLLPIYILRRRISWRELLPFLPWVLIVCLSALWSPAPRTTLVDAMWSVLAPVACFLIASHLNVRQAVFPFITSLAAFLVALLVITATGAVQHLSLPVILPDWLLNTYPARGVGSTFAVLGTTTGAWAFFSSGEWQTRRYGRIFGLMGGCLMATSLILGTLGHNRMFWLAFAMAMLPWCLFLNMKKRVNRLLLISGAALIVVAGSFYAVVIAKSNFDSIHSALDIVEATANNDPRWAIWKEWRDVIAKKPMLGYGYGSRVLPLVGTANVSSNPNNVDAAITTHAHNLVLNVTVQTGLIGLLCFLLALAHPLRTSLARLGQASERTAAIAALSLLLGAVGKSLTDDFFFLSPGIVMWMLLGFFLAKPDRTSCSATRVE